MSRTVRDTAAMMDAINGPSLGDPYQIAPPARPYVEELRSPSGSAKIAFSVPNDWAPHPVSEECANAARNVAKMLESLGHNVEEDVFEYDVEGLAESINLAWVSRETAWMQALSGISGIEAGPDTLEKTMWSIYLEGQSLEIIPTLLTIWGSFNAACRTIAPFFEQYDYFITPTLALPPFEHGYLDQNADNQSREWWSHLTSVLPFTPVFNVTGQPAISLPLGESKDGMPIGVQIASRYGNEAGLIQIASQLEEAMPWADRKPGNSIWKSGKCRPPPKLRQTCEHWGALKANEACRSRFASTTVRN